MSIGQEKRFALLIDADNISYKYIKYIIDELTNIGVITYKRIYGDWTKSSMDNWKQVLLEYSITPMQQYSYTTGKNATDSAMIIDAMDILYSGKVDGFCLSSSDSDFTRLAIRLREAGMEVIGMGEKKTARPFITACSQFKYLDLLNQTVGIVEESAMSANSSSADNTQSENDAPLSEEGTSQTPINEIESYLVSIIDQSSSDDGWMLLSAIGLRLAKKFPDFDVRNYGHKKLNTLLDEWGFELKSVRDENNKENPDATIYYARTK